MNNNGFALMRYFRDLGADAHLLLNANDGIGNLSHFRPEDDTWNLDKWSPYIHRTDIPNAPIAALGFPFAHMISAVSRAQRPISVSKIRKAYVGYDRFVTSGIVPAVMHRAGLQPSIFFPYSNGVEFYGACEFVDSIKGLRTLPWRAVIRQQARGIRAAKTVLNAEMGMTNGKLREIGVDPIRISIPMVYAEDRSDIAPTKVLAELARDIAAHDFTVFHYTRLLWKNPGLSDHNWSTENKNNDWAIRAVAALRVARPKSNPLCLITEYGPSIEATRALISELRLEQNVRWLPKMSRREIMWLLPQVSACFGEFYELPRALWGGTGWEAMSSGVPIIQGFHFNAGEYSALYGTPPPPLVPTRSAKDVSNALQELYDGPEAAKALGEKAANWFQVYNGRNMAKRWLSYLS